MLSLSYGILSELPTPWNMFFLEKIIVIQLVNNFLVFMELRNSVLCLQEPAMGPYPEPFHILIFCLGSILISFHLYLGLLHGLFPLCFMAKLLYMSYPFYTCCMPLAADLPSFLHPNNIW